MNEKIKASLVLGSYLDTLGFNNGQWEFNFNLKPKTLKEALLVQNDIIHNFFALNGFDIDISEWNASDDTIMMIASMKACKKNGTLEDFMNEYIKILPELEKNKRASGFTTIKSLKILNKNKDISKISYNINMGGNGAAMRTSPIGLTHYKEDELKLLIKKSLDASRITHNYTLGYLGGLVTALFTSYAMRNIHPYNWGSKLLQLYESKLIDEYFKENNIYDRYLIDKDKFWDLWYQYVEQRLPRFNVKSKEYLFSSERYYDLIKYTPGINLDRGFGEFDKFASTGIGAVIVAYDALLMSIKGDLKKFKCNWENLIYFSTLHFGDNDSTGIIAGSWYGALHGFGDFNKSKIEQLEFKNEILKLV